MSRWSARAQRDLLSIGRTIARDNPRAAREFLALLQRRAGQARELPGSGRIVPEFGDSSLREIVVDHYRIVYRVHDHEIVVLTVFNSRRRIPL